MRNFPQHLNSRHDYIYVSEHFPPEQWKPAWESLLTQRFCWTNTAELAKDDEGRTDETHRVVDFSEGPEKPVIRMQQELREDSQARLFSLGFTVEEVQAKLC